jgi:dolichol kinase
MAMPLWQQEAAVVALVVVRVAVAIRGVCEGGVIGALISLVVCGWAVERSSENGTMPQSGRFRATRAPGIVLGAVTPPLVMASRLKQAMRFDAPGVERARVEFWSSIACSAALLAVLLWSVVVRTEGKLQGNGAKRNRAGAAIAFLVLVLQLGFSISTRGVVWCVVVAAGSAFVFHYFLQVFPSCTSAGEAMLVAHGFALYLANTVLDPLLKLFLNKVWPESTPVENVDPVLANVHAIVLGMLLVPVLYRSLLSTLSLEAFEMPEKEPILESASRAALFCFTILAVVLWAAPAWLRLVAGISQHPVLWILRYMLDQPVQRLGLCVYWALVIGASSLVLHQMTLKKQIARIMIRKGFHIMVVIMFVPALAFQADFVRISFALALGVFILVEAIRVWRIPPLGEKIQTFLKAFTDSRDSDVLIISHFSLLLGCAIPIWLSSTMAQDRPLAAYAGILSLGIGDTMASVVGYNFGSMRLSRMSQKTWEGTIAGIVSVLGASVLLSYMPPTFSLVSQVGSLAIAATCAGLLEAFTSQLDNAFVPIVYYSLLSL